MSSSSSGAKRQGILNTVRSSTEDLFGEENDDELYGGTGAGDDDEDLDEEQYPSMSTSSKKKKRIAVDDEEEEDEQHFNDTRSTPAAASGTSRKKSHGPGLACTDKVAGHTKDKFTCKSACYTRCHNHETFMVHIPRFYEVATT